MSNHTSTMLRIKDVCALTSLSRTSIYRLEAKGEFPRRVKLSAARVAWPKAAIEAWAASRQAATTSQQYDGCHDRCHTDNAAPEQHT